MPRGDEIYAAALRQFTTTNLSAEEIHKTGLEQVAELTGELDGILNKAGLTGGSVGERLTALNKRPDQVFANTDKGRAALLASIKANMAAMNKKLPLAFATVPDAPLEVRRVPVEIQDGASNGYYYPAALDGSRPAIYWINLKDTADWPKYSLPSLTYHEGNPGHHLHNSLMIGDKDLPDLLKNYFLSAYGEGWALYAEVIAEDMGGYSGIEKAGALQSWLFRAARLVVDTGIHAKQWSREQATDYFASTVGFTRATIAARDRTILRPAGAGVQLQDRAERMGAAAQAGRERAGRAVRCAPVPRDPEGRRDAARYARQAGEGVDREAESLGVQAPSTSSASSSQRSSAASFSAREASSASLSAANFAGSRA